VSPASERAGKSPTILVTGAAGFVGGHLLEHIAGRGEVVAWTRSTPPAALAPLAHWQVVDLLDRDAVRAAIRASQPSIVYHCAGLSQVDRSWAQPAPPLETNVMGTHHLLDALRRAGLAARVLITGSAALYAPSPEPLDETAALAPDSPYALSKLAQEMLGIRSGSEDGIDVVLTRAFNHTGPRQSAGFVAPSIARQIAMIERQQMPPVITMGNLDAARDISDVRDVVRAYGLLIDRGQPGAIYNVASGVARSIRSLVDTLTGYADVDVRVEIDPARLRPVDNPVLIGNATRLRNATGWTPLISFEQTMRDLLEYWRAQIAA
jgi:GDP-4-dehydro-6-deoxy-D-mannose reductase